MEPPSPCPTRQKTRRNTRNPRPKRPVVDFPDGGEKPVPAHDSAGRKRLAEYLLRHPFSLQKITWNPTTQTIIYRSKRHHTTKRNFEIFKAPDFIAAILRFRAGSFEWQAFGELMEAKNALRSLGEEGWRRRVAHAGNLSQF